MSKSGGAGPEVLPCIAPKVLHCQCVSSRVYFKLFQPRPTFTSGISLTAHFDVLFTVLRPVRLPAFDICLVHKKW